MTHSSSGAAQGGPLLLTLGDPNGLGPELVCRLLGDADGAWSEFDRPLLCIGPEAALVAHWPGAAPFWTLLETLEDVASLSSGIYLYAPETLRDFAPTPGVAAAEGGRAAGLSLEAACGLLTTGRAPAVVTLPLNKAMLQAAGFHFPGHTELFANAAGLQPRDVCMHLCGTILRVSLATTHPPLRDVPDLVTRERILHCLALTDEFLRKLRGAGALADRMPSPGHDLLQPYASTPAGQTGQTGQAGQTGRIAVCGLNPHAGEGGAIGREELEIIAPAVEEARARGMDVVGPLPGDTVFHRAAHGEFAAVLAMYHDQGLAPLKLLHFNEAVNVTLGLPFVRTSVDHGTGYDLVGTGEAAVTSLAAALGLAADLLP